jgi:hypothetical protein
MTTISNLPALTTATGGVAFPVVDISGSTKQATFSQLAAYVGGGTIITGGVSLSIDGGDASTVFNSTDIVFDGGGA